MVNTTHPDEVTKHSVHTLVFRSQKRTHDMFISDQGQLPPLDPKAADLSRKIKARSTYGALIEAVELAKKRKAALHSDPAQILALEDHASKPDESGGEVAVYTGGNIGKGGPIPTTGLGSQVAHLGGGSGNSTTSLLPRRPMTMPKPKWHAPWKLYRVISGHTGWVRCVAIEPGNEWFCTGAADRVIKIWDLASGKLKLSLTGHVSTVRGLAVSARQPYLFSCGEDRQVKCWDLEYNKVVRHYHGHLSAVYDLALHPTLDVLVSCGRDSTARVWDMRTKVNIHTLAGHTSTVGTVVCQVNIFFPFSRQTLITNNIILSFSRQIHKS